MCPNPDAGGQTGRSKPATAPPGRNGRAEHPGKRFRKLGDLPAIPRQLPEKPSPLLFRVSLVMRISGIVATTEPVKRGDVYVRLSVETLELSFAAMEGVPVIHGHNPLLLPLGKTERTWVEKSSETEASLHQDMYIVTDEPDRFIHEVSRTPCVHIPFTDSPGKFAFGSQRVGNSVTVDMSAVSKGSHENLIQEVRDYDEHVTLGFHDRQQEIPIRLIQFVSDMSLAETLFIAVKEPVP